MSARLNMNEPRNISWKGKTFNQVVAGLKMNTKTFSTTSNNGLFLPPPIQHYRREIANINVCNTRANLMGDAFFQPGGVITTDTLSSPTYTSEFNLTTNLTERPTGTCDSVSCSKSADAKRRVRSSGNIKRKFNASNDTYYTSANEYLISRNRTIKQNEYVYVRYGDPSYKPGSPNSIPNIYKPNGVNHCAKVFIGGHSTNPLFTYQWLDGIVYNFTIADGNYDIDELNTLFRNTLITNKHYYIDTYSSSKTFLFNFVYDTLSDKVQIQCFATNNETNAAPIHPVSRYTIPIGAGWVSPNYTIVPVINILNNDFQSVLGIPVGNYPPADISGNTFGARDQKQPRTNTNSSNNIYGTLLPANRISLYGISYPNSIEGNQFKTGSVKPGIGTPYVPLYYKPSNSKFASQGGVDSSSRLSRLKYDTVTNSTNAFMTAYGKQTANALAYGVPGPSYTIKDKVGYPAACTPVVKSNGVTSCTNNKIKGG
jgi:hypothetical protein